MNPDRRQLTSSSTHRSVAFSTVAICLGVAGMGVMLSLHHHRETMAENHEIRKRALRKPQADSSPFGPELQLLELFEHVAAPEQPVTTNDERPGSSSDSGRLASNLPLSTVPNASAAESVRNNISELAPEASDPPRIALQVPEPVTVTPVAAPSDTATPVVATAVSASSIAAAPVVATPVTAAPIAANGNGAPQPSTQPTSIRQEPPPPVALVQCGSLQCPEGEVCCNASCGTCARPGELCSQQVCGMSTLPVSVLCGLNECNVGEICCNASCGTCARSEAECD